MTDNPNKLVLIKGYVTDIDKISYHMEQISETIHRNKKTPVEDKDYLIKELFSFCCKAVHYVKD